MTHLEVTLHALNGLTARGDCNPVISVTVSACITLGLEHGEVMTRERLLRALGENLSQHIQDSDGEVIDASGLEDVEWV